MVASAWSRIEAEQAAADRAAARAAKPKRKPAVKAATQLLTITDLATRVQVSRSTVYRLMDLGLPHLRIGFTVRFDLPVVMQWFADYTAAGSKAHWSDDKPELQSQRGPTLLGPRRVAQPTDEAPTPERSAQAVRNAELRRRRLINPDMEGGSNGPS
jgi:excisionase family DNA binding protein